MRPSTLLVRSLAHYRRTHAAVVLGVAVAVAVLAGALLVGPLGAREPARAGARAPRRDRRGARRARGPSRRRSPSAWRRPARATAPLLSLRGVVTEPSSGRRASPVEV